ncbi:uncharacterized protein HKW66_Vig0239180 [Vigna angularis]|uniref:Uncharacterized protein n=1 Tax=Phaseolus angularis TaxID=3914 RepID=A0A8T0KTE1_PHAAN|nr:uncharacterized protein HKW66_Vig0239180 [Vigna angularis]
MVSCISRPNFHKPAAKNGSVTASAKKGNPAAAASSSDLSEESSDEDDVPKTKAVPAAAKNITSSSKKTQPSGSSDSDSDSSSDEDDKKKISATTKLPASSDDDSSEDSGEDDDVKPSATAVSKPAVSKKKVDSFDSNDSSSDEDNKKAAKKVSNAKSVPVSKQPVKTSSTSDSDEEVLNLIHTNSRIFLVRLQLLISFPPPQPFSPLLLRPPYCLHSSVLPLPSLCQSRTDNDLPLRSFPDNDPSKAAFTSDDVPVDDAVKNMATRITTIEDALLLKNSSLRDGWGDWFNKKNVFLRKDRMFRSTFDLLNPLNNPLLQDPDAVSTTRLTKGDHTVQKWWIHEFRKVGNFVRKNVILGMSSDHHPVLVLVLVSGDSIEF